MKPHILAVEDDETLQMLLVFCLEKEGYDITCASSAEEMYAHVGSGNFDLVLLDLGLPDAGGLGLIRELRSRSAMPIVVLTGNQDQGTLVSALELGVTDYLKKPFDPRELILRVTRVLAQVRLETQLREQATTDALSGLYNRRAFDERLEQEWQRGERMDTSMAILVLDVDFFKNYNDHFGHARGDECLRRVAGVLSGQRRAADFAARIGGEEFCLILPDTTEEGALVVAEAIRSGVEALQIEHPKSPHGVITISIGVGASRPCLAEGAAELLKAADQALYEAKAGGRNRTVKARPSDGGAPSAWGECES